MNLTTAAAITFIKALNASQVDALVDCLNACAYLGLENEAWFGYGMLKVIQGPPGCGK